MELAFDLEKYLRIQREEINKRIEKFGDKLYMEFGGKLFDDYHAERVIPGFAHDTKLKMLLGLKDKIEIVIAVNSNDVQNNKIREDLGISYEDEVVRLIEAFQSVDLYVSSVVLSKFQDQPLTNIFRKSLENRGIKTYLHYPIQGYPQNVELVLSDDGLGKNDYIETTRPLVVVTAPGPGSGKLATCLSQLYHENKRGVRAGYAKFETFPIWNIPLKHPINIAYEAATIDLNDVNLIDPYHLEQYGLMAVNYNRDVEAFPLLKLIFEKIYGSSPYYSPTDMGVNMIGFCISNDEVAQNASRKEIVRRYYATLKGKFFGKYSEEQVMKAEMLMQQAGTKIEDRTVVKVALDKAEEKEVPYMALELPDGRIVTGKTSELLRSPASVILNALKVLAGINDKLPLISQKIINPIQNLKVKSLGNHNPRLHLDDVLVALCICAQTNPVADLALKEIPNLNGSEAHSSVILSQSDLSCLKKLGIQVTEEPKLKAKKLYQVTK